MININKIKIYIFGDKPIDYDLYIDYSVELPDGLLMCLMLDNNRLSEELSDFESYYLDDLDLIDTDYYPALNEILDYIGLNDDTDGILDCLTYMPKMQMLYGHLVISNTVIMEQDSLDNRIFDTLENAAF
jgi:hypothetical protein